MTEELQKSWCIQRLQKPYEVPEGHPLRRNPFVFGGGLKNGGLSDDAMNLVGAIWHFDYMGSAEYEFGAVPEALQKLAQTEKLTARTVTIPLKKVPRPFLANEKDRPEGEREIYVLCAEEHADEIVGRVSGWATGSGPDLRDGLKLDRNLWPQHEFDQDTVGWLELENGFMFFTSEEMFKKTSELFGVES